MVSLLPGKRTKPVTGKNEQLNKRESQPRLSLISVTVSNPLCSSVMSKFNLIFLLTIFLLLIEKKLKYLIIKFFYFIFIYI